MTEHDVAMLLIGITVVNAVLIFVRNWIPLVRDANYYIGFNGGMWGLALLIYRDWWFVAGFALAVVVLVPAQLLTEKKKGTEYPL